MENEFIRRHARIGWEATFEVVEIVLYEKDKLQKGIEKKVLWKFL